MQYEIDNVVDECSTDKGTYYRESWKGHSTHTWEPLWERVGDKVQPGAGREAVKIYTDSKTGTDTHTPPPKGGDCIPACPGGDFQCPFCCWWTASVVGVRIHTARCRFKPKQRGVGSVSGRALKRQRVDKILELMPKVRCPSMVRGEWVEGEISNVSRFVHLGSQVQGGVRGTSEIEHRIILGSMAIRKHQAFLGNAHTSFGSKLSAYKMYITSVVLHGFEGWHLGEEACRKLRGFDIRAQTRMNNRWGWDYARIARVCERESLT